MIDHITPGVDALMAQEYKDIVSRYGAGYHSAHEAYGVLLEEVQEAEEALEAVRSNLQRVWDAVRSNAPSATLQGHVRRVEHFANELAAEAVQVGAVCRRMRGGCGE